ncbi:MAG: hypothetical protein DSZ31_06365 [Gammaproteobacteria bacterium]|nr:MAG: hypothetical protein DSZ31_06365 [Gammaproteobacteria bacterium]
MGKEITVTQALKGKLQIKEGIITVYGSEELLHKNLFRKLKEQFGDYQLYYGEEIELEDLIKLFGERSLFSGGKNSVNIIWQAEKFLDKLRKKQKEKLKRLFSKKVTNIVVFSVTKDLKKAELQSEPYKSLIEVSQVVFTAKSLNKTQVSSLIKKKFASAGVKISEEAVNYLLESFPDLVQLRNELEKILTYAVGKEEITLEEIKELSEGSGKYTVFDFQNAFFSEDLSQSLKILSSLMEGLTSYERTLTALKLEGLILSTVNKLLIAKERIEKGENLKNFAKELGLYYPFQVAQFEGWLGKWDTQKLVKLIKLLYKFDTDVKLKFLPAEEEFRKFVINALE